MKLPLWRFLAYALVILAGFAIAAPSFLPRSPAQSLPARLPATPVALGLDLRGGASLTLRADEAALAADMAAEAQAALAEALAADGSSARVTAEGAAILVTPRAHAPLASDHRAALEAALPTFQRRALAPEEPAFTLTEGADGSLHLSLRPAALAAAQADAMRENAERHPEMRLRELIDLSINQTLARSLYTSGTALLAMLPMAIWGGAAVQSFAIPMVFGILVAASSSIFIAAPILLFLGDWRRRPAAEPIISAKLSREGGGP